MRYRGEGIAEGVHVAFAGAERDSRYLQIALNVHCERVRAAQHAVRYPVRVLERRQGLAEIIERRAVVIAECRRVIRPYPERNYMALTEDASRHGQYFQEHYLGFSVAL